MAAVSSLSRLTDNRHHASDVLAGALSGLIIALVTAARLPKYEATESRDQELGTGETKKQIRLMGWTIDNSSRYKIFECIGPHYLLWCTTRLLLIINAPLFFRNVSSGEKHPARSPSCWQKLTVMCLETEDIVSDDIKYVNTSSVRCPDSQWWWWDSELRETVQNKKQNMASRAVPASACLHVNQIVAKLKKEIHHADLDRKSSNQNCAMNVSSPIRANHKTL